MILSNCAIFGSKKSSFIKNQEAKGLLSKLGIKTPLRKVPILGDILFLMGRFLKTLVAKRLIKMNKIVKNFLCAADKFIPEMHSKQPGFTYSACGPFT